MLHYLMFVSQPPHPPACHPERSEGSAFLLLNFANSVPGVYSGRVGALKSTFHNPTLSPLAQKPLLRALFSLFCRKRAKINPSFSYPYALFKKECFHNSFPINIFRTLLQNTRGCAPSDSFSL